MAAIGGLWTIDLMGGLSAEWTGPPNRYAHPFTRLRTQQTEALLACLVCKPGRHDRDQLVERFWPGMESTRGRTSLRVALADIRKHLEPQGKAGGMVIAGDRATWIGLVPGACNSDILAFESLLRPDPDLPPYERIQRLKSAAELYHRKGTLLPGCTVEWVEERRQSMERSFLAGLETLIALLTEDGALDQAIVYAEMRLETDPKDFDYLRSAIRLYKESGRDREVRDRLRTLRRLTGQDAETPGGTTVARRRGRRSSQPSPASRTDQLRLPLVSRLFGREEELKQLLPLLEQERLITLWGGAGFGKTRLAIEAASQTALQRDGVVRFVSLVALTEPFHIAEAILNALEQPRSGEVPLIEQVIARLLDLNAPILLVLDNAEHLLPGIAAVVRTLLERVPVLTCLVTSREPLALFGEQIFSLAPLPVPEAAWTDGFARNSRAGELQEGDSGHLDFPAAGGTGAQSLIFERLSAVPSVALFVERAGTARPGFRLTPENADAVAALCRKLEGVPLALELTAAWAATHSPSRMLAELEARILTLPQHSEGRVGHRSLEAALRWSYDLLSADMKASFAALAVFRGGWTAEAFAAVCVHPTPNYALKQLHQNSLIQVETHADEVRFSLLMTLREFAGDRLAETMTCVDTLALARRHADYYDALLLEAEPHLHSPHLKCWVDRVERESANIEAAIVWELQHAETPRVVHRHFLRSFWYMCGAPNTVCRWMRGLLPLVTAPKARAGLLLRLGANYIGCRNFRYAHCCLRKALKMFRELNDGPNQLAALAFLVYQSSEGNRLAALEYSRQALQLAYELENAMAVARYHGMIGLFLGKGEEARWYHAEAAAQYDRLGERFECARIRCEMGSLAAQEGDRTTALTHYSEALISMRRLGDSFWIATILQNQGIVLLDLNELETAEEAFRESLALYVRLNARAHAALILDKIAAIALRRADRSAVRRLVRQAECLWVQSGRPLPVPLTPEVARLFSSDGAMSTFHDESQLLLRRDFANSSPG